MKRALNTADQYRERYEDSRAKIAEADKAIQDVNRLAEEKAVKIAELPSRLAAAEVAAVEAQEAKAAMEVAMEAAEQSHVARVQEVRMKAVADYRNSEEFMAMLDKEVMDQYDDFVYRFKHYNKGKKLNLNFLRDPPPLPKGIIEEMVEACKGEDAKADSSSETNSSSKEDEAVPMPSPHDDEIDWSFMPFGLFVRQYSPT